MLIADGGHRRLRRSLLRPLAVVVGQLLLRYGMGFTLSLLGRAREWWLWCLLLWLFLGLAGWLWRGEVALVLFERARAWLLLGLAGRQLPRGDVGLILSGLDRGWHRRLLVPVLLGLVSRPDVADRLGFSVSALSPARRRLRRLFVVGFLILVGEFVGLVVHETAPAFRR
uniref:hypothetical protein n=1 Tax=Paractinoplanes polyasparticus TaxID=2856853 RepID=UPI001C863365|nr:hypothetical protein [Actinoplanes polyasparticus]